MAWLCAAQKKAALFPTRDDHVDATWRQAGFFWEERNRCRKLLKGLDRAKDLFTKEKKKFGL